MLVALTAAGGILAVVLYRSMLSGIDSTAAARVGEVAASLERGGAAGLDPETVTEETVSSYLFTADIPDPDLIIRTSGEHRLSNFLLWQSAYSELFFTQVLWPDFGPDDLREAVADFGRRERRFGHVSAAAAALFNE